MKQVMLSVVSLALVALSVLSIMVVEKRAREERSLNQSLDWAVKETMRLLENEEKCVQSSEGMEEKFTEIFTESMNIDEERESLSLKFCEANPKMGILSVWAEKTYMYPNGKTGSVRASTTGIIDTETGKNMYHISYFHKEEEYKSFLQNEGEVIMVPRNSPTPKGVWMGEDGQPLEQGAVVENNMIFCWKEL